MWYNTTCIPILNYSAPIKIIPSLQWTKINSPILNSNLPRLQINRKFPRLSLNADIYHGGMGLSSPHNNKIKIISHSLLKSLPTTTPLYNLLKIYIRYLQLSLGSNQKIFGPTPLPLYIYADLWICHTWTLLNRHNFHIKLHPSISIYFHPQRLNYRLITFILLKS